MVTERRIGFPSQRTHSPVDVTEMFSFRLLVLKNFLHHVEISLEGPCLFFELGRVVTVLDD